MNATDHPQYQLDAILENTSIKGLAAQLPGSSKTTR